MEHLFLAIALIAPPSAFAQRAQFLFESPLPWEIGRQISFPACLGSPECHGEVKYANTSALLMYNYFHEKKMKEIGASR